MQQFLEAVAQSLRNLGFEDAVAEGSCVQLRGVRFEGRELHRRSFRFCGRTYRSGNVVQAVLDLIQALPDYLARREKELAARRAEMELEALNRGLADRGLHIDKDWLGNYKLSYKAPLEQLMRVAKQIAEQQDIVFAEVDAALGKLSVTFTSEGGFSLN